MHGRCVSDIGADCRFFGGNGGTGGGRLYPAAACEGVDAVQVVRAMTGVTNGRAAAPGTIRGDFAMSPQENIVHTSDSPENALVEINRFFKPEEIFDYEQNALPYLYYMDEYNG